MASLASGAAASLNPSLGVAEMMGHLPMCPRWFWWMPLDAQLRPGAGWAACPPWMPLPVSPLLSRLTRVAPLVVLLRVRGPIADLAAGGPRWGAAGPLLGGHSLGQAAEG